MDFDGIGDLLSGMPGGSTGRRWRVRKLLFVVVIPLVFVGICAFFM
jgi:hypothetical protein